MRRYNSLSISGYLRLTTASLFGGGGGVAPPVIVTPVTTADASGWKVTYPAPPVFNPIGAPETLRVTRQGCAADGSLTTVAEDLTLMKRIREPYPLQATLTADQVSLSDFIYAGDTISGVVNNSTRPYPLPIGCWLTPDLEKATGSTFRVQLAVAHAYARAGRPVAAVKFIATDGVNTVEYLVNTMTHRQFYSGLYAPYFECNIDLATLNPATLCTVDVVIYPWVGIPFQASVNGSPYPNVNFTVLKFMNDKNNTYGTAYAYVDVAGNNTTAVVSATPATAAALPYATVAAAANAMRVFNLANYGRDNAGGGIIRLNVGEHINTAFASAASGAIPLLITATNPAAISTTIYKDAGVSVVAGTPQKLKIKGITLKKVGGPVTCFDNGSSGTLDRILIFEDVIMDINGTSTNNAWIWKTGRFFCLNSALMPGTGSSQSNANKHLTAVGCTGPSNGTACYNQIACVAGGSVNSAYAVGSLVAGAGQLVLHCFLSTATVANKVIAPSAPVGPRGFAIVGCVAEHFGGSTAPAVSAWADNDTSPVQNALFISSTVVGSRMNWLYQDVGTVTVNKSGYLKYVASLYHNIKTDIFGANANLNGNWAAAFNVGNEGNAVFVGDSSGSSVYGTGSWIGEVIAPRNVVGTGALPVVTNFASDQSFGKGGAGNGDYTPGIGNALPLVPAGKAPHPIDMKGRVFRNDGTAPAGALMSV